MSRCRHMGAVGDGLAACPKCATVQLDADRWALDVRWTLLRDPDAAPLRHDRAVTAADARWQQVADAWQCDGCGEMAPGRRREPPGLEVGCACTSAARAA